MSKRTMIIGDVHGCLTELGELIRRLDPQEGDRLIFVGDLVDKGPDSIEVLRYVKKLVALLPGSVAVAGNHEEKASRQAKREIYGEPWTRQAKDRDWEFIDSMPLTWFDADLNVRVIHGGIFPALLEKHPNAFDRIAERGANWRKGGGKVMNRARRILRVRYVDSKGDMLSLGDNRSGDKFWAETYDGSEGLVVYGHSPWLNREPRIDRFAIGIDTGCVLGGKLTAAIFGLSGLREFVTVQAKQRYSKPRIVPSESR